MIFKLNSLFALFSTLFVGFIHAQLNVNFSANTQVVCAGQPVQFTDLTTSSSAIVSWAWDFGNGASSSLQNPTNIYSVAGTYTVILTVANATQAISEVKTAFILVHPLPQPSFILSTPTCTLPTTINVITVNPSSGVAYNWNFGNGQTSTQTLPSNIVYSTAGTYIVTLTVTNTTTGCTNTITQNITINNYNTSFTLAPSTVCVGAPVNFNQTCSIGTNAFLWNFGNGQTSSQPNPSHNYTTAGTYTVTLQSQNTTIGCSGQSTQTVTVINAQQPSFSPSLTIGCNPSTVSFINTSGFNGTFNWDFGNGNTFSGNNPPPQTYSMPDYNEFPYPQNQSHTVIVYSTDANGCASAQTYPNLITIYNVFPAFSMNQDDGCETLNVSFTNNSFSPIPGFPITSWNWNFGNGNTSNLQTPPTQLYNLGVYNVALTITTANGCTATLDSLGAVEVGIPPIVSFTVQPDTICARQTLDLTNLTTINAPHQTSEISYFWYLGDQGPFSEFEPNSQPILDTGAIDIKLVVSFRGCKDSLILENEVYVFGPLVDLSHPMTICNPSIPLDVNIQDLSILGQANDSVAVTWWLGDGTTFSYNAQEAWQNNQTTFTHTFQNYGDYVVKQKAWNFENGCIDSLEKVLHINFYQVNLDVINDSVCLEAATNFSFTEQSIANYQTVNFSYTADNEFLGSFASGQVTNPDNYVFSQAGIHQISMTATNSLGCTSSSVASLYVAPWPEAGIELINILDCVPTQATFQNASTSISGVPISTFAWSSSGPSVSPTDLSSYTAAVNQTGPFTTNLTVTDALGCTGTTSIITDFVAPIANFVVPEVVCNNTPFSPQNLSQNFSLSQWYWNGQLLSTENNPELTFTFPVDPNVLSYNVTLKLVVSDGFQCTDEIEIPLIVSSPNANYSYMLTGANTDEFGNFTCPSVFGQFTDLSQSYGAITAWNWVFGDGKTSIFQNPSNTYVFAGVYTSSLTITDEYGCQNSITFQDFLTINGPSGVFGWIPGGTACDPNYIFEVYEANGVAQMQWFPGDGTNFSSLTGGEYFYPSSGVYAPFVIISDANNCSVTYPLDTLTVQFGNLNASFYVNPTELNWGVPLLVVNQSTGGIGGIVNNQWDFGNQSFSNNQSQFTYFFNQAGNLDITLVVTDSLGCKDTAMTSVVVTTQLAFPNVFSPNGDGSNDIFTFIFNAYREYEVTILNRWGNVMSQRYIVDQNYLWDGKAPNGNMAAEGVYYYSVKGILRDDTYREDYGFFHLVLE